MNNRQVVLDHFATVGYRRFYKQYLPELPDEHSRIVILSPFRDEQKPSFQIDFKGKYTGRWIDSGTKERGDIFDFAARHYKLNIKTDFSEIVRKIAEDFNISLPSKDRAKSGAGSRKKKSPEEVLRGFQDALPGSEVLRDLKERRGLTEEVIERFKLGCWKGKLVFPVQDPQGNLLGYKVHKGPHLKPDGTMARQGEGVKAQLYPSHPVEQRPIWIAAGEPDVWRLAVEGISAITGTGGEGCWKEEWTSFFKNCDVTVGFDNEPAGHEGMAKVVKAHKGVVSRLRCVAWPDGLPKGYDITDWLQSGKTLDELPLREVKVERVTLAEAKKVVQKWLHLGEGEDIVVDVVLGAVVANRFGGDPVWLFFVGPPGIIKTEILRTLSEWRETYMLSTLTPSTLISGFVQRNGEDPSLLPKLNGLVLILKDFTAILEMPREARQQILGDLRDGYDGQMSKAFGSEAGTRSYRSKFGILAAVTPAIDRHWSVGQQLGERFLKIRIAASDTRSRIARAMKNSGQEEQMRRELAEAMEGALLGCEVNNEQAVSIDPQVLEWLIDLADCVAVLRSVVARDGYTKAIEYAPEPEVGTRLGKQFAKLARGIAAVRGKTEVGVEEYQLIRRIARDTLPSNRRRIVGIIYRLFEGGFKSTQAIAEKLNMPTETAKFDLEDLWLLQIVKREGVGKFTWCMDEGFKKRLDDLAFFEGVEADFSGDEMSEGIDFEITGDDGTGKNGSGASPDISSLQTQESFSWDETTGGGHTEQEEVGTI